jgi:hypothetical protein
VDEEEPASKSGRQRSKTSKAAAASAHARREKDHELKDARFMYLSIDEASTHVGVRFFRLLVGASQHCWGAAVIMGLLFCLCLLPHECQPLHLAVPPVHYRRFSSPAFTSSACRCVYAGRRVPAGHGGLKPDPGVGQQ